MSKVLVVDDFLDNVRLLTLELEVDGVVGKLGREITHEPLVVRVTGMSAGHENIEQRVHFVDDASHKGRLLDHLLRDINVGELFELMIHARQFPFDVVLGVRHPFLDPGNIEKDAAMRTPPPCLDFAHDATRDVITGQ